jgi:RNA polymerase sigma-70 factor, ECF subfamily
LAPVVLRDETDEVLVSRYREGEVRAFEVLLTRHRGGVYNFLRRHVGDETVAEDLLQEVFLRVVRSAGSFAGESKFTTWLYTIARNVAIDAIRRGSHRRTESLDASASADQPPREHADPTADVEREATRKETARRLEAAIARLPADLREVLLLRERSGIAFQEIAVIVGCPVNTAKSRMRYALERLREYLTEDAGDSSAGAAGG